MTFVCSLETAEPTAGQTGQRDHAHPFPSLIELIFCLGSVWAKLELSFQASVSSLFNDFNAFTLIFLASVFHESNELCLPIRMYCLPARFQPNRNPVRKSICAR